MAEKEVKSINDVAPATGGVALVFEDAEQVGGTEAVVNKELIFEDISEDITGEKGVFIVVKAREGDKVISFATGSKVVVKQLKKAKAEGNLPVKGTVKRVKGKRYFVIE